MSFAYITEKGVTISKQQGRFVVGRTRETILEIPEETLEGLLVADTVQLTSQAMVSLLNQGVPVTCSRRRGSILGVWNRRVMSMCRNRSSSFCFRIGLFL